MILTTKKTEERDDARRLEYQAEEEKRGAEESRRTDIADERALWSTVLQTVLEQDGSVLEDAIREADAALDAYRTRFQ